MKIYNKKALADYIAEESDHGLWPYRLLKSLIDHFEYSIKDIGSYEELTDEEKQFMSESTFELLTTWGK